MQDFPSLILRSQQYTHTNGAVVPLLMAEGTVPMYYQVLILVPPNMYDAVSHRAVKEWHAQTRNDCRCPCRV